MKRAQRQTQRTVDEVGRSEFGMGDLMAAVLENALVTYRDGLGSPNAAKRVEAFKVEAWVASDDLEWPFSFLNVCRHIRISAGYVRDRMAEWRSEAAEDEPVH